MFYDGFGRVLDGFWEGLGSIWEEFWEGFVNIWESFRGVSCFQKLNLVSLRFAKSSFSKNLA